MDGSTASGLNGRGGRTDYDVADGPATGSGAAAGSDAGTSKAGGAASDLNGRGGRADFDVADGQAFQKKGDEPRLSSVLSSADLAVLDRISADRTNSSDTDSPHRAWTGQNERGPQSTPSDAEPPELVDAEEQAAPMDHDVPTQSAGDQSATRIRNVLDQAVSRETSQPQVDPLDPDSPVDVSRETFADTPIAAEAARAVRVLNPTGNTFPRPAHRRVLTVANQKGGVGKTTSAVNLAVALSLHGARVLVIDLDPQGNASTGLGVEHHSGIPSIYEVLLGEKTLAETAVRVEAAPHLWCVPATIDLAGAEIELVSVVARESRLRRAIDAFEEDLDYVFIDCPPSLGLLTVNAMVAAEEVLIPIQCEYYALEGLGQLLRNIELVQSHLNNRVRISTILLTMYDGRTRLADQVAQEVRSHFGDLVLESVVPRSVRVSEAPGYGQSVMTYDPGSRGAITYLEAAREIAERGAPSKGTERNGAGHE